MALLDFFRQKQDKDPRNNYIFSDDDRQSSLQVRKLQREIKELELEKQKIKAQAEIDELKLRLSELTGSDEPENNTSDMLMLSILAPLLAKQQNPSITPPTHNMSSPVVSHSNLSDDDIRAFIAKQDRKYIKIAKTMPKELVKRKVSQEIQITDDEMERAYKILMEEF